MEYKKTMEFGWISDDGNMKVHIYKDNFWPEGAIMVQVGEKWCRMGVERWLKEVFELHEWHVFRFRIGRLGICDKYTVQYEGWKPLFWRFHWKLNKND